MTIDHIDTEPDRMPPEAPSDEWPYFTGVRTGPNHDRPTPARPCAGHDRELETE